MCVQEPCIYLLHAASTVIRNIQDARAEGSILVEETRPEEKILAQNARVEGELFLQGASAEENIYFKQL